MTNKRKKKAKSVQAKTGMSYAAAINQLNKTAPQDEAPQDEAPQDEMSLLESLWSRNEEPAELEGVATFGTRLLLRVVQNEKGEPEFKLIPETTIPSFNIRPAREGAVLRDWVKNPAPPSAPKRAIQPLVEGALIMNHEPFTGNSFQTAENILKT